jgi:1,4-dihydroxy-2-naphthoate octaprenyltransferase
MAAEASLEGQDKGRSVKGFLVLSRIPFLSPGLAALTTGILIALIEGNRPPLGLIAMALIGIALIMLVTYYFNEYFDYEGDLINKMFTKFSGGSRALPDNLVPRKTARVAGYGSIVLLAVIAILYLLLYFKDYPLLLPLGLFGAFCGIFYSTPPFRWAYQGIGEIMIGGCYGILAMLSGYYLASAVLDLKMVLIGLPAALTIFGVIVANEFPDYDADKAVNKRNLIVRFGMKRGSVIYLAAMLLTYPVMLATMLVGVSWWIAITGLPVLILCLAAGAITVKGGYAVYESQLKLSGITLLANLTSALMFALAFYLQGL